MTDLIKTIQGSELIYRLGWTLLHTVWLGAAVGSVFGLVLLLLRRRSANARYLSGCVAMALMVAAPAAAFFLIRSPAQVSALPSAEAVACSDITAPALADASTSVAGAPAETFDELPTIPKLPAAAPPSAAPAPSPAADTPWLTQADHMLEPAFPWVVLAWATGVMMLSVWQLGGWIAARRLKRLATLPEEPALAEQAARLARVLRVSRPVRLLECVLVRVPTVLGWLRPVILLPVGLAAGLSPPQVQAILAHELAHIRRYDYLVNLLQAFVETLLFYHPATWFISRRLRVERENCCDDIALAAGAERFSYAESLLHVVRQSAGRPRGLAPALRAAGRSSELRSRIGRLLGRDEETSRLSRSWPIASVIVAALACALALTMSLRVNAQAQSRSSTQPAPQPARDHAEIERLIKQLGSEKFKEREDAEKALKEIGIRAVPDLLKAAEGSDTERALRAERLLKPFVLPRTKEEARLRVQEQLHREIADWLGKVNIRYGSLSVIVSEDLKGAECQLADPKELRKENERDVWAPVEGFLKAWGSEGGYGVIGYEQLQHVALVVRTIRGPQPVPPSFNVMAPVQLVLADREKGNYRWRADRLAPSQVYDGLVHYRLDGTGYMSNPYVSDRKGARGPVDLVLSVAVREGRLVVRADRVGTDGNPIVSLPETSYELPPGASLVERHLADQDWVTNGDYLELWSGAITRDKKLLGIVSYAVRLAESGEQVEHVRTHQDPIGAIRFLPGSVWTGATQPATQPAATQPSTEHIAQLISKLGSQVHKEREQAQAELVRIGLPAVPALTRAAANADPEIAARADQTWAAICPLRVKLLHQRDEYLLGENIVVHFRMENHSAAPVPYEKGAFYPSLRFNDGYHITAMPLDESGNPTAKQVESTPRPEFHGGPMSSWRLEPGQSFEQTLYVGRYLRFVEPGRYRLRIANVERRNPKKELAVGETEITLKLPTPAQARQVYERMKKLPGGPVAGIGERQDVEIPDFEGLLHPVYLPILAEYAGKGDRNALTALGQVQTPESVKALVGLVEQALRDDNLDLGVLAYQRMGSSLPNPRFYDERYASYLAQRDYVKRTWRDAYSVPLRKLASLLAQAKEVRDLAEISYIYACVGKAEDLPDLVAAYTKSIEATKTLQLETQYSRPRGSAYSYQFSTRQLLARGAEVPPNPATTGEAAVYFIALHDRKEFRPEGWVNQAVRWLGNDIPYMRELVLEHLPQPVPQPVLDLLPKLLADEYVDLQIAACHTARQEPRAAFREPILNILRRGTETYLLNAAAEAAGPNGIAPDQVMEIWTGRIDGDLGGSAVARLLGVIDAGDGGSSAKQRLSAEEASAAKVAWTRFIQAHRGAIRAGQRFKPGEPAITPDLFPPGFDFWINGKPWAGGPVASAPGTQPRVGEPATPAASKPTELEARGQVLAGVRPARATDADARERFLTIERFARLPTEEQAKQLPGFYRELAPRSMNPVVEMILSSAPTNILDRSPANGFRGNTALWAKQLADAAPKLSPEEVADKLTIGLWLNVAARARAIQVLKAHVKATEALIQEDLKSRQKASVNRAAVAIGSLQWRTFTDELLAIYLGDDEEMARSVGGALGRDGAILKPLLGPGREGAEVPRPLRRTAPGHPVAQAG